MKSQTENKQDWFLKVILLAKLFINIKFDTVTQHIIVLGIDKRLN